MYQVRYALLYRITACFFATRQRQRTDYVKLYVLLKNPLRLIMWGQCFGTGTDYLRTPRNRLQGFSPLCNALLGADLIA